MALRWNIWRYLRYYELALRRTEQKLVIQNLPIIRQSRIFSSLSAMNFLLSIIMTRIAWDKVWYNVTINKNQEKTMIRMHPQYDVTVDKQKQLEIGYKWQRIEIKMHSNLNLWEMKREIMICNESSKCIFMKTWILLWYFVPFSRFLKFLLFYK